jgi:SET domain-containing protein
MDNKSILERINKEFNSPNIYISECELGFCVRAKRDLRKGEIIYTFQGPEISFEETLTRGETECMSLQFDFNRYIDTVAPGMYINHSCEPNTGIINDFDLMTIEQIPNHTEIRFDYSTTMDENHYQMECKCGRPSCRKIVTDFKLLPSYVKEQYLKLNIVMSFIRMQYVK